MTYHLTVRSHPLPLAEIPTWALPPAPPQYNTSQGYWGTAWLGQLCLQAEPFQELLLFCVGPVTVRVAVGYLKVLVGDRRPVSILRSLRR